MLREYRTDNLEQMIRPKKPKTGIVLGVINLFTWILPLVGIFISVVGLIRASEGMNDLDWLYRVFSYF